MKTFFAFAAFVYYSTSTIAQQQWKFHIAFEEATGQKDTLWLIWDSTAHAILPVDVALGEGPSIIDNSKFNVWIYNANLDSTKTMAYPFNVMSFNPEVRAFNYQYPINIYWDSSLFSYHFTVGNPVIDEARIDNDYFWSVNNDNLLQAFNMLLDSHAYAPAFTWFSQSQFPMYFLISRNPPNLVESLNSNVNRLSPNPTSTISKLQCKEVIENILITDILGNAQPASIEVNGETAEINFSDLPDNIYFLIIVTNQNHLYHEKIIKDD